MNKDEMLNLVPLAVTLLAPVAAKLGFSAGDLTAFLTGLAGIAAGVYLHWNQKKVPETAIIAPVATAPAAAIPAAKAVLGFLAVMLAGSMLFSGQASAQVKLPFARPASASTASTTATAAASVSGQDIFSKIVAGLSKLDTKVIADIQAADAMAVAVDPNTNMPRDPIAHACYGAEIQFIQSLQGQPTLPEGAGIVVTFEIKRIVTNMIKKGLPDYLVIGCAPLFQDEATIFVKLLGMVGIAVALPAGGLPGLAAIIPGL